MIVSPSFLHFFKLNGCQCCGRLVVFSFYGFLEQFASFVKIFMLHVQGKLLQNCFWGVTVAFLNSLRTPSCKTIASLVFVLNLYHLCKSIAILAIEIFGHLDIDWIQGLHGFLPVSLFCFVSYVFGCFSCSRFLVCDGCLEMMLLSALQGGIRASSTPFFSIIYRNRWWPPQSHELQDTSSRFGEVHETLSSCFSCLYFFTYCWLKHIEDNGHL